MAKIRNIKQNGIIVEQPIFKGTPLTKWVHNGIVVWENGDEPIGGIKGLYFIRKVPNASNSYLCLYSFETGTITRLYAIATIDNTHSFLLYADKNNMFMLLANGIGGNNTRIKAGYGYADVNNITYVRDAYVGNSPTLYNSYANVFTQNGMFIRGYAYIYLENGKVEVIKNLSSKEWNPQNLNMYIEPSDSSEITHYIRQFDFNDNTVSAFELYEYLGKKEIKDTSRTTNAYARINAYKDKVFLLAVLIYRLDTTYVRELIVCIIGEEGIERKKVLSMENVGTINNGYYVTNTDDEFVYILQIIDSTFTILKGNGIDFVEIALPNYFDVYDYDKTSYARIIFRNGEYAPNKGTEVFKINAHEILFLDGNVAIQDENEHISKLSGLVFYQNGYYVFFDNYEMRESDKNILFKSPI